MWIAWALRARDGLRSMRADRPNAARWAATLVGTLLAVLLVAASAQADRISVQRFPLPQVPIDPLNIREGPESIALGADGAMWFAEPTLGRIGRITTMGELAQFGAGMTSGPQCPDSPGPFPPTPELATRGRDGAIWFLETGPARVGRIDAAGRVNEYTLGLSCDEARATTDLAPAADGGVFVPEADGFVHVSSEGHVTILRPNSRHSPLVLYPSAPVTGADGALWFVEQGGLVSPDMPQATIPLYIGRFAHGRVQAYTRGLRYRNSSLLETPGQLIAGPDRALWFGLPYGVGRIRLDGTITQFHLGRDRSRDVHSGLLAYGSDGNVWFTAAPGLGRITPAGQITVFQSPGLRGAGVNRISAGPGNTIWLTDDNPLAPAIVRVTIPPRHCTAPDVRGRSLTHARRILGLAHCRLGRAHPTTRPRGVRPGLVASQRPRSGTSLGDHAPVDVWVASRR